MKETKQEKELKKKVMEFLVDEWKHNVPLERLNDPRHIKKVIEWVERNDNDKTIR